MNQILDDYSFETEAAKTAAREFFAKVYAFMFGALIISGAIAYQYGTPEFIASYFLNETGTGLSGLFWLVILAPVGISFIMQSMVNRLSFSSLFALFGLYSLLIGFSLSSIFVVYSLASIASTFVITAGAFGTMAVMGYTTKVDLTRMGSLLYMVFFGIIIAVVVNIFLNSPALSYLISILGVAVFTGLTAYHMQQLKAFAHLTTVSSEDKNKMALMGGFTLYVLFINLFLSLLRLFGSRD